VIGRETRLPLQLRGTGIGPKAVFSYDVIDIGDVFVTSMHKYVKGESVLRGIATTLCICCPLPPPH
jgi:hypothetical protein